MAEYFVKERLPEFLNHCPQSWINFISYLESKGAKVQASSVGGYSVETLNEYLARYDAEYAEFGKEAVLAFASQRGHLLYIMHFGFIES